ncbi:YihY family inner membrane protein [Legionella dresdenensis]|uniref:UPF0761 membrane protein ACFORL_03285 n=1 Tax=Legionella dresdenensis TaxID=450200 RepID=A0ABV8CDR0_9GAMM
MDWKQGITNRCYKLQRFIRFVVTHFIEDDCTYRASALAFTSLLAIVPLMTVGLSLMSSFPAFQNLSTPIQNFIFENFVPATGKVVQNYLQQFVSQVSHLSVWGIIFLFVTALLLMFTIERSMNKIWRIHNPREGVAAFLLYWAILSLSPIFLGLSLAASSYIISMPLFQNNHTPPILFNTLPVLLSLIGFTFLYVIVPNRSVRFWHGLVGGIFATTLIESVKQGFIFYLSRYDTYQLLYGAFATVPIFFVWIYWVWLIALLGAEISYALSVHHERREGPPIDGFSHALLWLYELWQQQKDGLGLSQEQLIDRIPRPFLIDPEHMLYELIRLNLIHCDDNRHYLLSRDLHEINLYWLSEHLAYPLPQLEDNHRLLPAGCDKIFIENDRMMQKSLSPSLAELFSEN